MENNLTQVAQPVKSMGYFNADQLEQALRVATQFYKAGCFGKDVQSPEQAFVKIQAGAEMGLAPMESMNSLYIVNGKITMWGMALSKRLREYGWSIEYLESSNSIAKVKITKGKESYEYTATPDEMKNSNAYKFAPKDKLKWHALSRLVRFNVPEILGPISYTAEEAEDVIDAEVVVKAGPTLDELLNKISQAPSIEEYQRIMEKLTQMKNILTDDEKRKLMKFAIEKKNSLLDISVAEEPQEEEFAEVNEPQQTSTS